ncbi:hypothetical protein QQS21_002688 [Conoideocrella luteorostrata]|uniref:Uncharacterized protein n=1 Tax=Conoideocrella luteorostrata TaxID=1105319 RepID=A0AAJ0CUT0_9HYPO|nr:hypothetical protein QQS21_002688 [Conoideocrella luteorostrata]
MVSASPAAERLSVTTAIIGLLAVGGKVIDALWDLNAPANKAANSGFAQALQEIKQCRSTVHILYKTFYLLESAQLPFPERGTWIAADYLIATLTDTVLALSDLQAICETLALKSEGLATPPPEDAGVGRDASPSPSQKTISGLCSRIRWHNLSMTMMMTILKCPGESDAQNSKVGLERRMTRLISANTDLSGRLRQLEDVFHRESLPHYSPPSRHPQFWLLPRLIPYPTSSPSSPIPARSSLAVPPGAIGTTGLVSPPSTTEWTPPMLSPLSGYTLADIPILSIIPLPVTTSELVDGNNFYTFAYARRVSHDLSELMQCQAGQGTSRSLGVILGRTNAGADNGGSSSSTDSSSDGSPVAFETVPDKDAHTNAKKWRVRSFKVRRRWRA